MNDLTEDDDRIRGLGWSIEEDWGLTFLYKNRALLSDRGNLGEKLFCCRKAEELATELEDLARCATAAAEALRLSQIGAPESEFDGRVTRVGPVAAKLPCGWCGKREALELDGDCGIVCVEGKGGCGAIGKNVDWEECDDEEAFEAESVRVWNEERAEVQSITQYLTRRFAKRFADKTVLQKEEVIVEVGRIASAILRGRHWG